MGFNGAMSRRRTTISTTVAAVALFAVVGVVVASAPASAAPTQVDSCRVIDSSGTYELTRDITNSTTDACIEITASDVTFDGNGYVIDGNGGTGTGIFATGTVSTPLTNVTVTDVTVSDWTYGIRYQDVNDGEISDNEVRSNSLYGIFVQATFEAGGSFTTSEREAGAERTVSRERGETRWRAATHRSRERRQRTATHRSRERTIGPNVVGNSVIANNYVHDNGDGGTDAGIALSDVNAAEVSDNTVVNNDGFGVYLYSGASRNELVNNTVTGNSNDGFELFGGDFASADNNILSNNIANNNKVGFDLNGGDNNELVNNTARNNAQWAFSSTFATGNDVTDLRLSSATVSFEGREVALAGVESPPANPANLTSIGQYVNASSNFDSLSFLDVQVSYTGTDVSGVNESSLGLWRYNGSWSAVPDSGVNTAENYVSANVTDLGYEVFAPLGTEQQAAPGEPKINVMPDSVAFGNVTVDENETRNVTVTNTGTAPLDVSTTAVVPPFDVVAGGASFTLEPGTSQEVTVEFAPQSTGEKGAPLIINSNASNQGTVFVSLSGTGVEAGPEPAPTINVSPDSLEFGNVTVGETATDTVIVTNDGNATLQVNATDITGTDANAFTVSAGGAPFEIAPGETQTVTVEFTPESVGDKNATLSVESNDTDNATVTVSLTGTGEAAPAPEIAVSPDSLNFGNVTVGENETRNVIITNTGDAPLEIPIAVGSGPFNVIAGGSPPAYTIAPGETQTVTVEFAPESADEKDGALVIQHNDTDTGTVVVDLSGTGVEAPLQEPQIDVSPANVTFGNVTVDESATDTVTVTNDGNATLQVNATDITGANASAFIVTDGEAPFTLEPGQSRNVTVEFVPDSSGNKSATLLIGSNDTDNATIEISLDGTAEAAQDSGDGEDDEEDEDDDSDEGDEDDEEEGDDGDDEKNEEEDGGDDSDESEGDDDEENEDGDDNEEDDSEEEEEEED